MRRIKVRQRYPFRNYSATLKQVRGVGGVVSSSRENYEVFERKARPHVERGLEETSKYSRKIQRAGIERTAFGGGSIYAEKPSERIRKMLPKRSLYA